MDCVVRGVMLMKCWRWMFPGYIAREIVEDLEIGSHIVIAHRNLCDRPVQV